MVGKDMSFCPYCGAKAEEEVWEGEVYDGEDEEKESGEGDSVISDDMKEKAVEELSGFMRFYPVKGTEAGTTLEDHSADFVTTAQAFHWFDVPAFATECR